MFASENTFQKIFRIIMDIVNVVIGIAVVVLVIMAFLNLEKHLMMFSLIFFLGGVMNLFTGIKFLWYDRKVRGCLLMVAAVALFLLCYASYIAIGA